MIGTGDGNKEVDDTEKKENKSDVRREFDLI